MAIFWQTKRIFAGRSSATVKKICEVWRKMDLFGPDNVPPNQLQILNAKTRCFHGYFDGLEEGMMGNDAVARAVDIFFPPPRVLGLIPPPISAV